ncbi:hypothetical protein [Dokdonella fugitiva]|uniref:Alpha-1,2-glucosyltransferase n=1 Tax=Dokdonella fugitiva TaxID=328517 RepID=A0A4R2IDX9_9GAMM|nr:hypothetical protein [Dokdonella fugitiva]TCO41979.1 alpha-1,2-glucosyltransferase [Dokdonella fugitiva]
MTPQSPTSEKPRPVRGFSFLERASSPPGAWAFGLLLGALYVAGIVALRLRAPFTDEIDHFTQITQFLRGTNRILTELTTIPGYHALVAAIMRACGADSLDAARLANAGFGLFAVAGFHALRRRAWPGTETLATAQVLVLPILVPLLFLVYTDVLALALLLWAAWASVSRRHVLAALFATALVGVRQHEVVWTGLLVLLALGDDAGRLRSEPRRLLASLWPYAVPVAVFVAFWAWNGSISLSRTQAALHPDATLHAGNPLFALLVAGLVLPLQVLQGLVACIAALRRRRRNWLLAAVPVFVACGFWFGFHADHPYNSAYPSYYVHNHLPLLIEQRQLARALAALVAAAAACALATFRLRPAGAYGLFPVGLLFLAASWLVELRYALVPLVFWLAFREHRSRAVEYATWALWLALAVCMYLGTLTLRLFL